MTHPRKIIRQAAVAHLVDKTSAEERVFAGRLMPVEEPELPAIVVHTRDTERNTARWSIAGAIKRGANAASTAMVGTPTVTMTHNDSGASAWIVAVTADTTNGGIKVQVTGAAATTIRWVCKINTTEMTY